MNENTYISGDFADKFCRLTINNFRFILLYLLIILTPLLFFMTKISNFVLQSPAFKILFGIYIIFILFIFMPILRKIYLDLLMNQPIKLTNISAKNLAKVILIQIIKFMFSAFFVIGGLTFLRSQSYNNVSLLFVISLMFFLCYIAIRCYFAIEFVLAQNSAIQESFQQSWNLTQNNFWRISFYILIVTVVSSILKYVFLLSIPFLAIVDSIMFSNLFNENYYKQKLL